MTSDPAAVLETAADLLIERGWCQGANQGADGQLCAASAIAWAADRCVANEGRHERGSIEETVEIESARIRARGVLKIRAAAEPDWAHATVESWNDAENQSRQRVVDTMRSAAKRYRGEDE